ncbi:helix-turn-helix domain-containing protein [Promicromonospora iranensis]|uniref:Transcriptional regulator with XRE-family HTH domain n=1 Tax=Promicromonospora iranensis TaxID=1105144 RepID=A0ABU2CV83_9MICO|nr:helix-turn-helix transcriptional regulator [Promicromonospora iranensis]MDR7385254.1 transcriptional regulator with XRE-family HTH domain [Promicromonospora iranensis]
MENTKGRRQAAVEALGKTIKAERNAAGLSLDALGAAVGIHRNTVHNYEKGAKEIPFGTLVDIADALGLDVTELTRGAEMRERRGNSTPEQSAGS